jgi:hypothetical protein
LLEILYSKIRFFKFYAIDNTSSFVKLGLKPTFFAYLFLDFILKTLTFSQEKFSFTLNSTFDDSTKGVQTFVSFHSSSETRNAFIENLEFTSLFTFFTSITSHSLTIN